LTAEENVMRDGKKGLALVVSGLFVAAIALSGLWLLWETKPAVCIICSRTIHAHSSAVVVMDKMRVTVCCIRCGITHNFQIGKPGEVVAVTEYFSNRSMNPKEVFYVEGSQVSMCDPHEGALVDQTKHPYNRVFDRCEPSTYAFANREDAERFVRDNGGKLLTWDDLKKEVGGGR
jgi:hypothetical protein